MPATTEAMSASSNTITGALPPSSRCVRLIVADGGLQHLPAGIDAAGQRHHGDLGVTDQRVAGRRAAAGDDIHHAFGEDVGDDLGELQRRQRRLLGRLDDDGVAAGESRRELPGGHHQRIVPRRDRADHADRIAADHRGVARHVFAGHGRRACCARRRQRSGSSRTPPASRPGERGCAACRNSALRAWRSASASVSMASASFNSSAERSAGVVRDQVWKAFVGGIHRRIDLGRRRIGELDDGLLGLGIDHGSPALRCRQRISSRSTSPYRA